MCPSLSFYLEKKHSKHCNATAVMSLAPHRQHVNGKNKNPIECYWLPTWFWTSIGRTTWLVKKMANIYLIVTSLIFPVVAISWLCCIACCIYKSLLRKLDQTTKVQVTSNFGRVFVFLVLVVLLTFQLEWALRYDFVKFQWCHSP